MEQEEQTSTKWSMPFNIGYESFQLILKTLFQQKADVNPVPLSRIGSIAGLNPKTISSNMTFLKAIKVVKEESKDGYMLTPRGVQYARGFYMNDPKIIKEKSIEIIKNSHLKTLYDVIDIKKDSITISDVYSFVRGEGRYAEGAGITGMTPPYATGAKTLLHIFKDAGFLPNSFDVDVSIPQNKKIKQNKKPLNTQPKNDLKQINSNKHLTAQQNNPNLSNNTHLSKNVFGRVIVEGVGVIDVKDKATLELAKSFFALMEKKISGITT